MFPYLAGKPFVQSLYQEGGWQAVNAAYANPPVSSEQVLHPERYPQDIPQPVSLPPLTDTLGSGWRRVDQDTLGELDLQLYLDVHLSQPIAYYGAEGWGGDRYAVYWNADETEHLLLLRAVWDSAADADEFFAAYTQFAENRYGHSADQVAGESHRWWLGGETASLLARQGLETLVIVAPDEPALGAVLAQFPGFEAGAIINLPPVPVQAPQIVASFPHDPAAYTQGLLWSEGALYESTGLYEGSTLRRADLESGEILGLWPLPDHLFGEGLTVYQDRLIQLTWQSNVGLVYDRQRLELLDEFYYPGEGWGLTHDGQHLILSDGSATLRWLDPETYQPVGQVEVHDGYGPVSQLNELEYVRGEIYANVWQSDRIARIDPQTGRVIGWIWIELDGLFTPEEHSQPIEVLNGIAYDAEDGRLFVTGKLWPRLFEIELPGG